MQISFDRIPRSAVRRLRAVLLVALLPAAASAQALTDITSLFVSYSARKNAARPAGELKARLDSVDRDASAASRQGRTGEVRRLLAKGNVLLSGGEWTDVLDFSNSLLIRTDHVVADSRRPFTARLEQFYSPAISLSRPLIAQVAIKTRPSGSGATAKPAEVVKTLGTFDGVSRDLRDAPLALELDVHDVPDGTYQLAIDVLDSARVLASPTLTIVLRKGIDDVVARLDSAAKAAPPDLQAEILYPADRMRNVNRGRLQLRTFDVDRDFAAAEAVALALKARSDPFAGRTGDIKRHYLLDAAAEIMPYRLYVPTAYVASRPMPLIVALHGLGATEDSFFDSYEKKMPALAERDGYLVVAPLGYRVDGFYGYGVDAPPRDPASRRSQELSEADVMAVIKLVRSHYNVDAHRIYLMGHSMGAIGAWRLGAKYPELWRAMGVFSGQGNPANMERMKSIPQFVVHGDADNTVNVQGSRSMTAAMKTLNMDFQYIEVPGGSHVSVVAPNLDGMFQFFNAHSSQSRSGR